jgi:hypothetical protein
VCGSYKAAVADFGKAIEKKDEKKAKVALDIARSSLLTYRQMARIDTEDGGCIELPLGNAQEVGHAPPLSPALPRARRSAPSIFSQHGVTPRPLACVRACVRACVAACVRACGRVCDCALMCCAQAGHGGAPLGYVVPAFRGGGISMDYALRDGEQMMKNGQITDTYREKYQK